MDNLPGALLQGQGGVMDLVMTLLAAQVLHGWDARRAAAYAAADPAAVHALYAPGSTAGLTDCRLARAYAARGLVVRRLVTQVLELSVVPARPGLLRVRVVDRVAGGEVVSADGPRALPTSPPALRVITFRRLDGAWRVVSVREPAPRGAPSAHRGR